MYNSMYRELTQPYHQMDSMIWCLAPGVLIALYLAVLLDALPFRIVLPIWLEELTVLRLTGVLVVGNLACAVLARRGCAGTE